MQSFSDAVGMTLTDAEYDKFIDKTIVGADRQAALYYLKLMPPNMRGDFIYVDPSTGRVLSNRVDLRSKVQMTQHQLAVQTQSQGINVTSGRRAMSYPPNFGSGGPFIRWYSFPGENALMGYATPPCDISLANPGGDSGSMYFNAYSAGSSGSIVDGGIAQGLYPNNSRTVNAFVNIAGSGYLYSGWTDEQYTWSCGQHLGIMFGTLSTGTVMMLAVGIPAFDPTQFQLPPATATWVHSAWNFFPIPYSLAAGANPGNYNGNIPSPCMNCYVARMFTIAEGSGYPDGSCYGGCSGVPDGRWDEVVGGNLVSPCSQAPTQATCTIEYESNGSWVGGEWDSDSQSGQGGVAYSEVNDNDGLEGLNDNYRGDQSTTASNGQFQLSLPIAPATGCTPDAMGYCVYLLSQTQTGSCDTGLRLPNGRELYQYDNKNVEYIFQMQTSLELVETATETLTYSGSHCLTLTKAWSPSDPAVQFSDPALP